MTIKHANDGIKVWCDPDCDEWPDPSDSINYGRDGHLPPKALAEVTCKDCLRAIAKFGNDAGARLNTIESDEWLANHRNVPKLVRISREILVGCSRAGSVVWSIGVYTNAGDWELEVSFGGGTLRECIAKFRKYRETAIPPEELNSLPHLLSRAEAKVALESLMDDNED